MNELIEIQGLLKAPKGQTNNFGKYKYRSCEDILEAVKPLCVERECMLTLSDETLYIGNTLIVQATASIRKESVCVSVTASAAVDLNKKGMDYAQSFGTSSSYARKYALNGLFCIDDTKDSDTGLHPKKTAKDAITEINEAKTLNSVKTIWTKYVQFQRDAQFIMAKDNKKSQLTK